MYVKWTTDAINCYELNCNCKKCFLAKVLETPCVMYQTVKYNLEKIGTPEEEPRKPFTPYAKLPTPEEIIAALDKFDAKAAAKKLKVSAYKLNSLMKEHNINGYLLNWKRKKKK